MNKTVKLAFVDAETGEFYVRENSMTDFVFSNDVAKAKLYMTRAEVREYFDYVSFNSNRNLKCVEVEVSFSVLGDSDYLDQLENRDLQLYKHLNKQAEDNIDAMSEDDYHKWKSLRSKFRNMELVE
jgi:hypothetical protein